MIACRRGVPMRRLSWPSARKACATCASACAAAQPHPARPSPSPAPLRRDRAHSGAALLLWAPWSAAVEPVLPLGKWGKHTLSMWRCCGGAAGEYEPPCKRPFAKSRSECGYGTSGWQSLEGQALRIAKHQQLFTVLCCWQLARGTNCL